MAPPTDIQRTWQIALPPQQVTQRLADLLRAYGGRVTLQADDFVAAEFGLGRWLPLAVAGLVFAPWLTLPLLARRRRRADVITAESQQDGEAASQVVVTSSGRARTHVPAADLGRGLDRDRRPIATV
jgi:hypothetical protein